MAATEPPAGFRAKQVGVALGMAFGLVITVAAFFWGAEGPAADPQAGVGLWAACSAAAGFWLALSIAFLARYRFFAPADIDGAGMTAGSDAARRLQGLIQNTLEQASLAAIAYAAWLLIDPVGSARTACACTALFSVGRLIFFIGYGRGAAARALGFALTFYPTVGLLALSLIKAISVLARPLSS